SRDPRERAVRVPLRPRPAVGAGWRAREGARQPRGGSRRAVSRAGLPQGGPGVGPDPGRRPVRRRRPAGGHSLETRATSARESLIGCPSLYWTNWPAGAPGVPMNHRIRLAGLVVALALCPGADLLACGDKFLVAGRGTRYQRPKSARAASVLI